MQTVFAYADQGPMQGSLTKWKPRRVLCTTKKSHASSEEQASDTIEHVVKYRQGKQGAAALISEVVAGWLLEKGGLRVLDRRLVEVSREFADSCKEVVPYPVTAGLHFGTVRKIQVEAGPPPCHKRLSDSQDLVDLWAFDTWLGTIDRDRHGNMLLELGGKSLFRIIACDQSDCFGGTTLFSDGAQWQTAFSNSGAAPTLKCIYPAIFDSGAITALTSAIGRVTKAATHIDDAIGMVPGGWWDEAEISPDAVKEALEARVKKLDALLNTAMWADLPAAIAESMKGGE